MKIQPPDNTLLLRIAHRWPTVVLSVLIVQVGFSLVLKEGAGAITYYVVVHFMLGFLLILATGIATVNAVESDGTVRIFWSFLGVSGAIWTVYVLNWIYTVEILRQNQSVYWMLTGGFFLRTTFLIAAVASRPHIKLAQYKPYRTTLSFLLLLFSWAFAYAFVLFPVSYIYPDDVLIIRGLVLHVGQNLFLFALLGIIVLNTRSLWKSIYGHLLGASLLSALGTLISYWAIVHKEVFASWPTLAHCGAAYWFVWIVLQGRTLAPQLAQASQGDTSNTNYASALAMAAVVAVPVIGMWELLRPDELHTARVARLFIVLLAVLFLAIAASFTWYFTHRELSSDVVVAHERLQLAMASGKSVGWEWNIVTGEDRWFGDLQNMFGIPSDTFSGRTEDFYRYVHPDDRKRVSEAVTDARANHKSYESEFRVVWDDGTTRWISARGTFYYSKTGKPERMLGMAVDITERKRTEEALKNSEERFSKAFRESPLALVLGSAKDFRFLEVNDTFEQVTGWTRGELIGRTSIETGLWVDLAQRQDFFQQLLATGAIRNWEARFRRKNGTVGMALMSAELIETEGQTYTLSVMADITDRKQVEQQLRDNQEQLAGIVASALDAFVAIDDEQRIVLFNPAAEKMFGCSATEAIGKSIERFIPERFRAAHAVHIRHFGETGITNRAMGAAAALWGLRSNGEEFPIEASISHAQSQGKHLFTVIIRDITERRRTEEARRESEERLQLAFQAGKMYAYEWDVTTDTIIRSPACKEVLGNDHANHLSQAELLSDVLPEDRPKLAAFFDGITPDNIISHVNYRMLRSDGTVIWLEKSARAFFDDNGKLLRAVGVVADITDRKLAEQALVEDEERFRLVANTAPVLIWMSGPDKLCTYVNHPWLEFTGRPQEEALGDGWTESVHPDDLRECLNIFSQAVDRRAPFTMQYRLRRHDGEYRWVLDTGLPRFNANHSLAGYIGSCVDIADRKLVEEALGSIGRRLIEAQEEERTWIARELHDDVNQRLALLAIELQRAKDGTPASENLLRERIDQTRTRLIEISKDVQALSHRLHSSKLEYLGIVAAANSFCKELVDRHKVTIEFNYSDIPQTLSKEISLGLFRVLQEALQNAVKHSGTQQFKVELRGTGEEIYLTVSDSGIGFDWHGAMSGRGLGLISMRERLQLMRGRLSIESERGSGTTISAWVPLDPQYPKSMAG